MEELADKNNSPLKDSEIARLIDVSNSTGYKKQESIPTRNLIDFKPKSLLEIALKDENKEKKIKAQPDSSINQDEKVEESQISETEISESAKAPENQNLELEEPEGSKSKENEEPNEENAPKDTSKDTTNHNEEGTKIEETASEGKSENLTDDNQTFETKWHSIIYGLFFSTR